MTEIIFLEIKDVIEIHKIALEKFGGQDRIRDRKLLESAIAQPQHTFGGQFLYTSIPEMAAIYAFHIAENQPFIDGNKRAAFASSLVFLKLNKYLFITTNDDVHQTFIGLANKTLSKDELIEWYKDCAFLYG